MGDDGLHVDEAGAWARRLGRVAYRVATRSARRSRGRMVLARRGGDDRGGLAPSGRDGARMSGQAPEFRDVIGGRDAHIEQKGAGHADVFVGWPGRERRAVRHGGDSVGLDHALARWIAPDLARITAEVLRPEPLPMDSSMKHQDDEPLGNAFDITWPTIVCIKLKEIKAGKKIRVRTKG